MRDDPSVIALVTRVADGDQEAWNELVERYAPLVWTICCRYGLSRQDIDDVGQGVWLMLVEKVGSLRQPAALPGWLATTTRNECLRLLRAARRYDLGGLPSEEALAADPDDADLARDLIAAEQHAALRAAFADLGPACRRLLSLLMSDPPPPYAEVGDVLGIPIGSIGPTRGRCLGQLRRSPRLADFFSDETSELRARKAGR